MWLRFIILFGLLFFSFCISKKNKIKNKLSYTLESVFVAKQKNSLAKGLVSINFDTKLKTANCSMKCNPISLNYKTKFNKFNFSSISSNNLPCPDHLLGLELDLKENFNKINRYEVKNQKIYFFDKLDTLLVFYEF